MTTEKRNDEIDLIELFLKMYIFIKKNFWILFLSGLIGGALGYSSKFFTKKHFESSMLIETYTLSDDIIVEYMNNIQNLIKDNNYDYLSIKTGIEKDKLSDLNEIKAEKLYDEKNKKELKYIKISAKSNNNAIFNILSNSLLKYLNQESYVNNEIEIYIEQNTALIDKFDEEIQLLEELQRKNINDTQTKSGVNIYNEQTSFHKDLIGLLREKQQRQKMLKFATPFRVIEDFIIYQKPIKKTVTYTLTLGFLFGFIALFYLIFRNINKLLKEKELN